MLNPHLTFRKKHLPLLLACAIVWFSGATAQATIAFNITYNDVVNGTGVGFNDPTHGATRQATVTAVTGYLNSVLNENGTVDITINNSQTDGGGFLASAGPLFYTSPNRFDNGFAFTHATTGSDPWAGGHDASATFDFGYNWNSGTGAPTGSQYDLFSVTLHEFSHAIGFLSLVNASGNSGISGTDPGVFSVYDSFLERGDGTALFGAGGDFLGTAADLTSGDVFFDGPNATAANGGNPIPVYAPGTFNQGSSISHINLGINEVMQYSIGTGALRRAYSAQELGMLQDIGYSVIPEPSSFLFLGLAGCLFGVKYVPNYVRRWKNRLPHG